MIKETYVEGITKDSFQTSLKLHGTERRELGSFATRDGVGYD